MNCTKSGIIDLSSSSSGCDTKRYLDAGTDSFIFRASGQSQWMEGKTWNYYMDQAAELGVTDRVGSYIAHDQFTKPITAEQFAKHKE